MEDPPYKTYIIFGRKYPLPLKGSISKTKQDILIEATLLFCQKGYAAVSMRDIANAIGIKPASLYNHFKSKEKLWHSVLNNAVRMYLFYLKKLDKQLEKKTSIEDVLDIILYEPKRMRNILTCHAFSVIKREQFYDNYASKIFEKIFLKYSVKILKCHFDRCIDSGSGIDTEGLANLIMVSVLWGTDRKVSEYYNIIPPYDNKKFFENMQKILLRYLGAC